MKEIFGDVESAAKQAAALRELADHVERGEVYACLTVVIGQNEGKDGPTSEVSEWWNADHEDVKNEERRHHMMRIMTNETRDATLARIGHYLTVTPEVP